MKLLVVFSLCLAAASAVNLFCDFNYYTFGETIYQCNAKIRTYESDYIVEAVNGRHIPGKGNDDVTTVVIKMTTLEAFPQNLHKWFKNYRALTINMVKGLPNLQRSDFSQLTNLKNFYAGKLDSVSEIAKDTFYDLKELSHLYFDEIPNLGNLDADLLINARKLTAFSAKGPNKITQLSPGFFRNQVDTLKLVDFRFVNFVKISYSVFQNLHHLEVARFHDAGCLNYLYTTRVVSSLTADIRSRCQDVTKRNDIDKMGRKGGSRRYISTSDDSDSTESASL